MNDFYALSARSLRTFSVPVSGTADACKTGDRAGVTIATLAIKEGIDMASISTTQRRRRRYERSAHSGGDRWLERMNAYLSGYLEDKIFMADLHQLKQTHWAVLRADRAFLLRVDELTDCRPGKWLTYVRDLQRLANQWKLDLIGVSFPLALLTFLLLYEESEGSERRIIIDEHFIVRKEWEESIRTAQRTDRNKLKDTYVARKVDTAKDYLPVSRSYSIGFEPSKVDGHPAVFGALSSWSYFTDESASRIQLRLQASWNPHSELRKITKRRLLEQCGLMIDEEFDRILAAWLVSGFHIAGATAADIRAAQWLYRRLVHGDTWAKIAHETPLSRGKSAPYNSDYIRTQVRTFATALGVESSRI